MSPASPDGSDNDRTEEHDQTQTPPTDTDADGAQESPYPNQDLGPVETLNEEELDFLNKKGAVQILPLLADGPKQFSEINNAVTVSKGTVSTRLTEGAKLGLWSEEFRYPDDGGKIKQYKLQPYARPLGDIAKAKDIPELAEEQRKARQQYDAAVDRFLDEIRPEE